MSAWHITWTCPKCEQETDVTVYPLIPAKTYGPPERCHPEEGGDHEPGECEHCGAEIPNDDAYEQASKQARDSDEAAMEARAEQREEDRRLGL
jgi:hypothetical protein